MPPPHSVWIALRPYRVQASARVRTIEFTDAEVFALRKMFPRHLVVGAVEGPDTPLATALYKLSPTILPYTVARDIKAAQDERPPNFFTGRA